VTQLRQRGERGRTATTAAHRAVLVVFAMNGVAFATWASRIPDVKIALGLTPGQLGLTLLVGSCGSLLGLPSAGWVADRFGASRSVWIGVAAAVVGISTVGVGVTTLASQWTVAAGLFLFGLGAGVWDVGMNLEGATVERLLGRTTMPHYHAAFSGGTVVSALVGAVMSWARVPVLTHLVVAALVLAGAALWASRSFLPRRVEEAAEPDAPLGPMSPADVPVPAARSRTLAAWMEPRTLLIGVFVLVAAFTEGTANDWVSVALHEGYDLPPWAGVLGFATFLTCMTAGRVVGTVLLDRYGRVPVLRVLLVMAGVGSVLVVAGPMPLAFAGAALWGFGTSLGFPVGMSAAADEPEHGAARISVVATIGYGAFLGGPPLLGFLGDHVGVLHALLVVSTLLVLALVIVPVVREPRRDGAGAPN
jgi:MFS family permease